MDGRLMVDAGFGSRLRRFVIHVIDGRGGALLGVPVGRCAIVRRSRGLFARKNANGRSIRELICLINVWMVFIIRPSIHLFYAREVETLVVLPFCVQRAKDCRHSH